MADTRRALITGITGQDGSYLAQLLLGKGYEVHGIIRRSSSFNTDRLDHIYQDLHQTGARLRLHYGDLADASSLAATLRKVAPDEVYHLGARSHVRVSFDQPIYTVDIGALGTLKLLEAVREYQEHSGRQVRYYQASSSEMYGNAVEVPQDEMTPFHPRSPYACAKVFGHHATVNYREAYDLHASCGILFNHESERRGETFVTRKITRAVGRIKLGLQDKLFLGNLDAQHPRYYRPTEVDQLQGDASKARRKLGWEPRTSVQDMARRMVDHDMELARQEKTLRDAGHKLPVTVGHDQ